MVKEGELEDETVVPVVLGCRDAGKGAESAGGVGSGSKNETCTAVSKYTAVVLTF